jgi:hypothetical protein
MAKVAVTLDAHASTADRVVGIYHSICLAIVDIHYQAVYLSRKGEFERVGTRG